MANSLDEYIREKRLKAAANSARETEDQKAKREANLARLTEENRLSQIRRDNQLVKEAEEAQKEAIRRVEAKNKFQEEVTKILNQHIRPLMVKNMQTLQHDAYGNIISEKWFSEIDYFINNVLSKNNFINEFIGDPAIRNELLKRIDEFVQSTIATESDLSTDVEQMSGLDFEVFCANILRKSGWEARVTVGSGDQGIDIVATDDKVKAVFQCKKYSQSVGNAAVQEIIAGKQFEKAQIAAVISTAPFTRSAIQLANSADVYLLHYSELSAFAESKRNLS